jgi:hypothetical protein
MNGPTLYEEVWEGRRNSPLENEMQTPQVFVPEMIDDLQTIFKEALGDALARVLDQNEARALMLYLAGTSLQPDEVFAALDSMLREGSEILKDAIVEEYHTNAHVLLKKMAGPSNTSP